MAKQELKPEAPSDAWRASTRLFSPFVALCAVGFLGRLSYEMMRTPLTPLYAKQSSKTTLVTTLTLNRLEP